jgi:hypothetical protein
LGAELGRVGDRFIHEQDGNVVTHRIDAAAFAALETLAVFLLDQRFFANRANQNFEKFLGDHGGILRRIGDSEGPAVDLKG